ncbi:hypothetical protein SLS62_003603 [Diatrype stigma]|uniref:Protein kinase domain-containing protein n=1 Tax=Diatrype stigma TaxID=117547 RepID=A0AAN9YUE7_9PEZI
MLSSEISNSKTTDVGHETIATMATTTNFELLAARDDSWARDDDPSKCRFLVDGKSIKYVLVEYGVYPKYWVDKMHNDELAVDFPPFPVGAWNVGRISKDPQTGAPCFSRLETLALPEAGNAWHPTRIDYFDLATVERCPDASKRAEKLRRVAHPSFPGTMLMKIADFPSQLPWVEREIRAYRALEGTGLTPRFLGHVTESGRVVGFLLEWLEGADQARPATLEACHDALKRLHEHGIYHGSAHTENFLCCSIKAKDGKGEREGEGKVFLIDFEKAKFEVDDVDHKYKVRRQNRDYRSLKSSMSYLGFLEDQTDRCDDAGYESDTYSDWTPDDADDYIF